MSVGALRVRQLRKAIVDDLDALETRALSARFMAAGFSSFAPSFVCGECFVLLEGWDVETVAGHGADLIAALRDALQQHIGPDEVIS